MDKSDVKVHENQSDTSSVITMKEYAASEYPSSEPPPAYMKPRSNALRIAKLAAFTVIVSSIILGGFMFAASWIQARATRNLDLTLNQELLDDLHPNYEQLVGNEAIPEQQINAQESVKAVADGKLVGSKDKVIMDKNEAGLVPPPLPEEKQEEKKSMDLDEIANMLMEKNIRGNVNCIVEKRRNEELVDHAPMSLNLPSANSPFGLNITTPPRLQHVTGEQIIVICKGDEDEEKEEGEEEDKAEQAQPIVFPLPQHLIPQFQQVPQTVPVARLIQQIPVQQAIIHQIPVQQPIFHQIPIQQQVFQQPQQQQPLLRQPERLIVHPPVQFHLERIPLQQPQQMQQPVQIQPHQVFFPQQMQMPQMQQMPMMQKQEIRFQPEIIPIREVRLNEERIPMNHILHNRVNINPMAVNDIPVNQMPITHMPMKTEVHMEEPVPVHHLVPPQPQEEQMQNFNQEEPRFNRPIFQERVNRLPFMLPPAANRINPEIREPRLLRIPNHNPRFPIFPSNEDQFRNVEEVRPPTLNTFPRPVEGRIIPIPSQQMKAPLPFQRPMAVPKEAVPEPKIIRMIPLFNELRNTVSPVNSGRIRFPDSSDSEEDEETRVPIITEITKIVPITIEREETRMNSMPLIPLKPELKNDADKLDKIPERPFPIPINAILDMIFRGIRPLMGNRLHSMPIPVDIKIERIEKPIGGLPIIKRFELMEKEPMSSEEDSDERQESNDNQPVGNTLMIDDIKSEDKSRGEDADKDFVEAKVERVEVYEKEDNTQPIPISADAEEPQIFRVNGGNPETKETAATFESRAFLPNGQGRGARVFPIPQQMREAEIFSVSDARSNKNLDVEVGSSFTVTGEKVPEGRQGREMVFPLPPESEINSFPMPEGKAMKPLAVQTPQIQPQTFTINDARSVQLYPVETNQESSKPVAQEPNGEDNRPHYVQPRSV